MKSLFAPEFKTEVPISAKAPADLTLSPLSSREIWLKGFSIARRTMTSTSIYFPPSG